MAVATGVADVVVCYRGFNERSGQRFGQVSAGGRAAGQHQRPRQRLDLPDGARHARPRRSRCRRAATCTSTAPPRRTSARVAVADRRHAATNPDAFFYGKPITLEDHQASRMIVDPLHLLDCCQESDGAVALVVTSAERARDLAQTPASIAAAAQGSGADQYVMTSYYRDDIGIPEMGVVGRELWRQSGLGPDDMPTAILYDHFTPYVLMQLEELGFCGRGEAPGLHRRRRDRDRRPAAAQHPRRPARRGLHPRHERHRRGGPPAPRHVGQPGRTLEHVLVTAGTGVPTSGLVLSVG